MKFISRILFRKSYTVNYEFTSLYLKPVVTLGIDLTRNILSVGQELGLKLGN